MDVPALAMDTLNKQALLLFPPQNRLKLNGITQRWTWMDMKVGNTQGECEMEMVDSCSAAPDSGSA